jgi:hypothetical protein
MLSRKEEYLRERQARRKPKLVESKPMAHFVMVREDVKGFNPFLETYPASRAVRIKRMVRAMWIRIYLGEKVSGWTKDGVPIITF